MKIKFNWGTGIFIVIILFFGSMALRIYLSYQQDLNLISEDYYPKEIKYQETINKRKNLANLARGVNIVTGTEGVNIHFPGFFDKKELHGEIWLYRPSDKRLDRHITIKTDTGLVQQIPANELTHGKYVIKIDLVCDSIAYYLEKDIYIK